MMIAADFTNEKLVIGVLVGDRGLEERLLSSLAASFGPIDHRSAVLDFTYTSYYDEEMGKPIVRFFVSFQNLVSPDRLASIKLATNALEKDFAVAGKRKINLDPGLLALSRFILASTKNSSHRVPLGGGIYAEIELMFEKGSFRPVEWTYSDYRSEAYIKILNEIREIYKRNLKAAGPSRA